MRGLDVGAGHLTWFGIAPVGLTVYRRMIQPWQDRRGASQEELTRPMPGDEAIPGAASTTCAITIDARPEQIWRWRVRIGFDGAGWYRYGRIDDDG